MLSYALTLAESILLQTWAVPWMPYAAALGVLLLAVAVISKQAWLRLLVALVFLSASAAYSIWVLPVGVMLAGLGLVLLIAGAIWRFAHRTPPHVSAGLMWPGAGLLVAPVANIFVVMPVLRMMVH